MMALTAGEPFGKAGSFCKRFLRALILLFTSVCNMWVRIRPSGDGRKRRPPSQLITIAVHPMKQMTVAMADILYRPSSCRNIEKASRANCHSSDIRSDFLALCHHCPDDIASLVALVCCSTGRRTCSSFKIHLARVMYDALPYLRARSRSLLLE